jgi:iron-sulfur cluster repair protein YtfE (RIC family)
MRITDAFRGEHGVFYAQFDLIERTVPTAGAVAEVRAMAAMLAAALIPHAMLENELLFIPLARRTNNDGAPISVMRMEHEDIEGGLVRAEASTELVEARQLLLSAIEQAREHFAKEEMVLFPLAEQEIDRGRLEELGDQWASRRAVAVTS